MNPLFANSVLHGICLALALIFFFVAAYPKANDRVTFGWLGAFFLALAILVF